MSEGICSSTPNPHWNCVQQSPGSSTIARLYNLDSHGQLSTSASGIIADIVSFGFVSASLSCKQNFIDSQQISVNCDNADLGAAVSQNPNCIDCKAKMQAVIDLRNKLEQDAHAKNPGYTIQVADPALVSKFNGRNPNNNDGICKYACLQCVIEDVEQTLQMNIDASCQTNTNSFISAFTSGMSYQAEYHLTQQQEALKSSGIDITSQNDIKNLSIQVSDSIVQMTQNVSLNALQQQALNIQSTIIEPESTSVVIDHLVQTISLSMFATLASATYNDTRMKDAINYEQQLQTITIETSFSDLIKQLEQSTKTMSGLVLTLVGEILISIIALLLTGIIIFVFYIRFVLSGGDATISQL